MFFKMVKNDFARQKLITVIIFIFMTFSVGLAASAMNTIVSLITSLSELKEQAVPADLVQMHTGAFDQKEIDQFTHKYRDQIAMQETMQLLTVDGSQLQFRNNQSMADSVQDISFVVQNQNFDFILDLNNQKLDLNVGEVAIPIYLMEFYDLEIGDLLTVESDSFKKSFIISDYARDYEMNSPLTSSKRIVIHSKDYQELLNNQVGEIEFLIEFKLHDHRDLNKIQTAYIEEGLPANGPTVGGDIFIIFNMLSDLAVAFVIIMISLFLILIALLCIRLTFIATMEEDLREIGIMKAIGIPKSDVKKFYLTKYRIMSILAGIMGYFLSFLVVDLFNSNMRLYLSSNQAGIENDLLSLIAPLIIYFIIISYCKRILKRMDKTSAVEALRMDSLEPMNRKYRFSLHKNRFFSTPVYMGLRDVWSRFKLYRVLLVIFIVSTLIVILPLNIYNTINSPNFSTYMGIGKADLRIDLRKTSTITQDIKRLIETLEKDNDIEKFASYRTSSFQVKNQEGSWDYIYIESGDHSVFTLKYLDGRPPTNEGEIALSYANANEDGLNKHVGDDVMVKVDGREKRMTVTGIYQDITNGGKTAKVDESFLINEEKALWFIVYLDFKDGVYIPEKIHEYQQLFTTAQISDIHEYTKQTLGNLINQIGTVVMGAAIMAILISALITSLFLKMLLSKDLSAIAIMRSIGLTTKQIKQQYKAGTMLILFVGIIFGVALSILLGESFINLAMSSMGAAKIELIQVGWQVYFLVPLIFILVVGWTISISYKTTIKNDLSLLLRS